ncbi:MAG TPA: hypothetical protein PKX74_09225, partial [Leptospiraceae bacterium]|nr:hypothetical protein [Leptospiraceae bacterium]
IPLRRPRPAIKPNGVKSDSPRPECPRQLATVNPHASRRIRTKNAAPRDIDDLEESGWTIALQQATPL